MQHLIPFAAATRPPAAQGADRATAGTPALRVVFLPAMGVAASYYEPLLSRLRADSGAAVIAIDLPGQGSHPKRARRGDDYGYRDIVEDALPRTVQQLKAADPAGRIVLAGHSLGGQLALLSLATLSAQVDALVLVAAGTAHWRAWPGSQRWRAAAVVRTYALLNRVLPWYPGHRLGFGGDQARRFMRDWSFNALSGRYRLEGSPRGTTDIEAQLAQVRTPVHVLSILDDPVAPPGATRELLRLLPRASVTRQQVRGVASDPPWRRHFSWARKDSDVGPALLACLASLATAGSS